MTGAASLAIGARGRGASVIIRAFAEKDRQALCDITVSVFEPVSIDAAIERAFGRLKGTTWQDRKVAAIHADLDNYPEGCFVAEEGEEVIGFVTTHVNRSTGVGRILNLAVAGEHQGRGVGRALVSRALDYFEQQGLQYSQIETVTANERGQRFYPKMGYTEVARQIYYFMRLSDRRDK